MNQFRAQGLKMVQEFRALCRDVGLQVLSFRRLRLGVGRDEP